ncbi:hypothetical protein PVT01_000086000 [Plasmodium vivax]|uniref:VIR protein n=1 Tax=Plasmodium vivax TaxID=5855 RepID=A0A1G4EJC1_PLAVI|nr:hypothetical protein PVT01_000086000 [Plasmodium vivax]
MYLNLWLNEQKKIHINITPGITEKQWNHVEKIWKQIEAHDSISKCARQEDGHEISHIQERKKLKTYCINRDYYKSLFQSSSGSEYFLSQRCKGFSDYTSKYYVELVSGIDCIDKKSDIEDYKYHISGDCTLYDIPKTFPKCDETTQTIVDVDNSKTNIICKTTAKVERVGTESSGSLAKPAETDNDLGKQLDSSGDVAKHPETPDGSLKLPEADDHYAKHRELDLQLSSKDANLTDNGPSKPIYYAGLSASGVFFTSMVLYKV